MTTTAAAPSYREWGAAAALERYVQCIWSGGGGGPGSEPVLPDGCMDVIWTGARLFVAGPDTGPVEDDHGGAFAVGVRFRPGAGPILLGVPAATLRDARVGLGELWSTASHIEDELAQQGSAVAAAGVLEAAVRSRLGGCGRPDPIVELAARRWSEAPGSLAVGALAQESGLTGRQLHRRFLHAVGYGPKRLQRILRFQAFLRQSGAAPAGLAELAARCGYADQAHLSRETAVLAGRTPAQLATARAGGSDPSKTGGWPGRRPSP